MNYVLLAAICVASLFGGWVGYEVREAEALRALRAMEQARQHQEQMNRVQAHAASKDYQLVEAKASKHFQEAQHAFDQSLQTPVSATCPSLDSVPVPAGVVVGLRDAWAGGEAGTPTGGSGAALPGAGAASAAGAEGATGGRGIGR